MRKRASHAGPAAAEIWSVDLDVPAAEVRACERLLDYRELSRARRLLRREGGRRWTVARAALKETLAIYAGVDPLEIELAGGSHGKPALARPALARPPHFNLAHSYDLALIALHPPGPVGIDVELVRERPDIHRLAERVLTENERRLLTEIPEAEQRPAFFRAWTRKEAIVKTLGLGLSFPVQSIEVSLEPGAPAVVEKLGDDPGEAARWALHEVETPPGYIGCFALRTGPA